MFRNLLVGLTVFAAEAFCNQEAGNNMFSEFLEMVQNENAHSAHHYHPEVFSHDQWPAYRMEHGKENWIHRSPYRRHPIRQSYNDPEDLWQTQLYNSEEESEYADMNGEFMAKADLQYALLSMKQ